MKLYGVEGQYMGCLWSFEGRGWSAELVAIVGGWFWILRIGDTRIQPIDKRLYKTDRGARNALVGTVRRLGVRVPGVEGGRRG